MGKSAEEKSESLSSIRSGGVDFSNRQIFLIGEINEEVAERIMTAVHVLDESEGTIHVTLSSGGGEEPAGYAIYDALSLARNHVEIDVYGRACSIAAAIFQAGDWRRMAPNADLMVHNGLRELDDGPMENNDIQRIAREIEADNARYRRVLWTGASRARVPVFTQSMLKDWCDRETFFSAEEAVKLGFADEIIASRKMK